MFADDRRFRMRALVLALSAALLSPTAVMAGDVGGGQTVVLDGRTSPPIESWRVNSGGTLRLVFGAQAGQIRVQDGVLNIDDGGVVSASGDGVRIANGGSATLNAATIVAQNGTGLLLTSDGNSFPGFGVPPTVSVTRSQISGSTFGSTVTMNGVLDVSASSIAGTDGGSYGLALLSGYATIRDASDISGDIAGIWLTASPVFGAPPDVGRHLIVDGSVVRGNDAAIATESLNGQLSTADVVLQNGAQLIGASGVAIDFGALTQTQVTIDNSAIAGDIRAATTSASGSVTLRNSATLTGAVTGDVSMNIGSGTTWTLTGDSGVSALALDGGAVRLGQAGDVAHHALDIAGDFGGGGGGIQLHTVMNAGGSLAAQSTDRLLIEGDVTTTGATEITVAPSGNGALTDANGNGVVDANEGISLVQVGGTSRADAFVLRGGYVAAGPYQYTLRAIGPGEVDQAQKALSGASLSWDYRIGNRYVCQSDCTPVDPGGPGPGDGGDPGTPEDPGNGSGPGDGTGPIGPETPGARAALVPQVPSYLSAPAALLTYGDMMNDGLHQRLGDIREGTSSGPVGGEVFARYLGGQLRYSSNLSFQRYGYDFDQQINALQLGGSLIALDGDNGSLRAGWAADKGTTRVTPSAADGNSSAKYHANGVSAWITWQHGNGFWVDGVIGATRYRGDVGTDLRGSDVGNVRAHGWTTSIEAGLPIAIGGDWTVEPRFQLKHQQLNFRDFTDTDGLEVQLGTAKQTSATLGGRITRTAQPRFMPYASLDLTHTSNGDPMVDVSSEAFNASDRFGSGRVGNAYRVAAGAVSQLGEHVQLYGEGTYQHFVGSYGMRGWAGNVGIRVSF